MGKKILALALCLVLLLSALPVNAASDAEIYRIRQRIIRDYENALDASGRESLEGYCGLLASYQLYYRGINAWLQTANGNDYYDMYLEQTTSTGGYGHRDYHGANFTMEEALSFACQGGRKDVYNALVCFQYTDTEAGRKYGHVIFVYAILDGIVYFTESFDLDSYNRAGMALTFTLEDFVDYYSGWTVFEGLIVFGKKDYADNCTYYSTNLFVEVTQESVLTSEPCSVRSRETTCVEQRQVTEGERLHATGLFKNTVGQYYYRISDGTQTGYLPAEKVSVLRVNFEDVTLTESVMPQALALEEKLTGSLSVSAAYSGLETVSLEVVDDDGKQVLRSEKNASDGTAGWDNSSLGRLDALPQGYYSWSVWAESVNHYLMDDGSVFNYTDRRQLQSGQLRVGQLLPRRQPAQTPVSQTMRDGWSYVGESWYYYENGTPRTGWFYHNGVDYYLDETGAVTTGWAEINGKMRYFTATGAMRTGWVITMEGPVYLLSNGAMAQGFVRLDGKRCYFHENGTQGTEGWLVLEDGQYYLDEDGSPVTGWLTLPEGTFRFQEDGRLTAQKLLTDGIPRVEEVQFVPIPEEE